MIACTLALVLLLDASSSISAPEWQAQVSGHADALEEVTSSIVRNGPVALKVMAFAEYASPMIQWRLLRTEQDVQAVARELRDRPRPFRGGTNIAHALRAAGSSLQTAPCTAEREVIDLVTDGEDFSRPVNLERDRLHEAEVTVNALGVGPTGEAARWLQENAITPGGFVLEVDSWQRFPQAIRRKLASEITLATTPTEQQDRSPRSPSDSR